MAFDLNSINTEREPQAKRIVIGGPNKVGKTTFSKDAPSVVFIAAEDGLDNCPNVPAFPQVSKLADVYECISTLLNEEHSFETVVLDSMDKIEGLLQAHVAKANGWADVAEAPYGRGYVACQAEFDTLLKGLDALIAKGITVICIVHNQIGRIESPLTDAYDAHQLRLHKKTGALLLDWCDIAGFADFRIATRKADAGFGNTVTKAVATGERILRLEPSPAHFAGSRYGLKDCPLEWAQFDAALKAATHSEVNA